jgi:hypothetical protein
MYDDRARQRLLTSLHVSVSANRVVLAKHVSPAMRRALRTAALCKAIAPYTGCEECARRMWLGGQRFSVRLRSIRPDEIEPSSVSVLLRVRGSPLEQTTKESESACVTAFHLLATPVLFCLQTPFLTILNKALAPSGVHLIIQLQCSTTLVIASTPRRLSVKLSHPHTSSHLETYR